MKRFLIVLMLLMFISPVFARTIQCVKKYQVLLNTGTSHGNTLDVTDEINKMICAGWKVISITPISKRLYDSNPTDYVIVIYEKEESK